MSYAVRLVQLDDEPVHPVVRASDQVSEALTDLHRHPDGFLHWPWRSLDTLVGGMAPGEVHYVCAFSGIGKTTLVSSVTNAWLDAGKTVVALPLETPPKRWRTYLACQRLGVHPGDAFSGELRARNDPVLPALEAELRSQYKQPTCDRLHVEGLASLTLPAFVRACREAVAFGADVVIVDHIDQLTAGDGTNLYAESVKVNQAAVQVAQEHGLVLLLTSQLNTDAVRGPDHLAAYAPPRESYVKFGAHKREIASSMVGLFRPLQQPLPHEDHEAWKKLVHRARAGDVEPREVLMPNTMGVVLMKDRNYGRHGAKALLRVVNGKVEELPERDQHSGTFGYNP